MKVRKIDRERERGREGGREREREREKERAVHDVTRDTTRDTPQLASNLIAVSSSGKYDLSAKITTHVKLPVTSQSKCVVIFVAERIEDP